jgi:hypothetical protein
VATRSDDNSYGPTVVLINPDEAIEGLDDWLALVAESEPVDLGIPAASLLDEVRRLDGA